MKKSPILLLSALLAMVSCLQQELTAPETDHDMFHASIESTVNSKVFLNEENLVLWSEDDCLAIFRTSTLPTKYQVTDDCVGQTNGKFTLVEMPGNDFYSGMELPCNIAFYPYSAGLSITASILQDQVESYAINGVELPTNQVYAEDSFADGAFLMAAVTESQKDRNLNFKNVLGALKLQLTGTQVVKSIKLMGANGEKLSGPATVVAYADNLTPSIVMADDALTEVVIDCGEGVQLNEDVATNFIFAIPPTEFKNGFTVVVTDDNYMKYELSTGISQSVLRSSILRMPPVAVNDELLKPEKVSISLYEVGLDYVDLAVQTNQPCEIAYVIMTEPADFNPATLFNSGKVLDVYETNLVRIEDDLTHSTKYHLYVAAKLHSADYTEVQQFEFTTAELQFTELLTLVKNQYDGYQMRITLPESTKAAGNAIRWNQCCLMMYNYVSSYEVYSLLSNANVSTTENITLEYSDEDRLVEYEKDHDGDGFPDYSAPYDPIRAGEPVVFYAGEFSYVDESYDGNGAFAENIEWWLSEVGPGYYMPLLDENLYFNTYDDTPEFNGVEIIKPNDVAWTGAFQRKFFRTREPELLDGSVDVRLVEASPVNMTLEFRPDENVYKYSVMILNDSMYDLFMRLINNLDEYKQWAVTSYFSEYNFASRTMTEATILKLTGIYYQEAISPETDYHVLVTAMGDNQGSTQSFQEYTFSTTAKQLPAPELLVTPLTDETTPFRAAFNVKCTTYQNNPIEQGYYAANYVREWELALNGGSTYFSILNGNNAFTYDELHKINSSEGLTMYIPFVDGETTRLAVLGYNSEYTPNDLTSWKHEEILNCPAVADVNTPYYSDYYGEDINLVDPKVFEPFLGEWTATATLKDFWEGNTYEYSSDITICDNLTNYPSSLPSNVYDLYYRYGRLNRDEVDALYFEFKAYAAEYKEKRLDGMNRILGIGWLNDDSYGRLTVRTPYDLFVAEDYSGVDIGAIYNDFGPKWFIEAQVDPGTSQMTFRIPVDSNQLPPAANWSIPFYMTAYDPTTNNAFTYYDSEESLYFPVEYDDEKDQITIKPFVYYGVEYYPNVIGIDSQTQGTILENPVVSEVVLTRKSTRTVSAMSVAPKTHGGNVPVSGNFPTGVYKQRTKIEASEPINTIEVQMMSVEQVKSRADEFVKMRLGLE